MPLSIRYIGSKQKLIPHLDKVFRTMINKRTVFADLFAGTGAVSYFVSKNYDCRRVVSNDLLLFSSLITRARCTRYTSADIKRINSRIERYNKLRGTTGLVTREFSPPKRMYFTRANAMKIDSIRSALERDKRRMPRKHYVYLLASLLFSCNRVANTTGVYAAYLKSFQKSAVAPLALAPLLAEDVVRKTASVYNQDAMTLAKSTYDVVYLDPPYNSRQYADNYHVLEYIARYKRSKLRGVTGMPHATVKSKFASKVQVKQEMKKLIDTVQRNSKRVVLSYNNEGLLTKSDIMRMFTGPVKVNTVTHAKYKSHSGSTGKVVKEYIFYT